MQNPSVFISYSHDSDSHKDWVYQLACELVKNGVEVTLDQWDIQLGSNIHKFMEKGLTTADRVMVVCTDNYNTKSNEGLGGAGYEKNILTSELLSSQDTTKFIPCIREVSGSCKTPVCLGGRAYIDFTDNSAFAEKVKELLHELFGIPLRPKPVLGRSPFANDDADKLPSLHGQSNTVFFSSRFSDAFPGVRGIHWFTDPFEAVERLNILFRQPIAFRETTPIWWWRTGEMHISRFETLAPDTILLDTKELVVDEIAAVNAGEYYQSFVYIKARPSGRTGLYDSVSEAEQTEVCGYAYEEYAIYKGSLVTRAEYDDGSTVSDGKVVQMNGEAKLRMRYVSPYNLLIAPMGSPINNNRFDLQRVELLNAILRGETTLEKLVEEVLKLPKTSLT